MLGCLAKIPLISSQFGRVQSNQPGQGSLGFKKRQTGFLGIFGFCVRHLFHSTFVYAVVCVDSVADWKDMCPGTCLVARCLGVGIERKPDERFPGVHPDPANFNFCWQLWSTARALTLPSGPGPPPV